MSIFLPGTPINKYSCPRALPGMEIGVFYDITGAGISDSHELLSKGVTEPGAQ